MTQEGFQQALAKLVNDATFRNRVESEPDVLRKEFSLEESELAVLSNVWKAAGGNVTAGDPTCCCCCCI
jgi:hypothetical protein